MDDRAAWFTMLLRLSREMADRLTAFAKRQGLSRTAVIRMAIGDWLREREDVSPTSKEDRRR